MDSSCSLFRVISRSDLASALRSGAVPRCASDERSGYIHLNLQQDVEAVANVYFSADEEPVALELRRSDIAEHVVVGPGVPGKPWRQIELHRPNIFMTSVIAVHRLDVIKAGTGTTFRLATQFQGAGFIEPLGR